MGLIVLAIVFSGLLSGEVSKGTLIIMLTKGLPRWVVILAKFTGTSLVWTASYVLSAAVAWAYTVMLFPALGALNLLFSLFCLWLFGIFLLSALIFSASLVTNHFGGLLVTVGITVLLMALNMVPGVKEYNPVSLASSSLSLLTGNMSVSWLYHSAAVSILLSLALIAASVLIFNKKQL
jgi:ABC-2 type transport system permease protein